MSFAAMIERHKQKIFKAEVRLVESTFGSTVLELLGTKPGEFRRVAPKIIAKYSDRLDDPIQMGASVGISPQAVFDKVQSEVFPQ